MNDILDRIWNLIETILLKAVSIADILLSPLEFFGPGVTIFVLAFLAVAFSKMISRFYVTKRFLALKKDFEHWQGVREEAMKHPDRNKGKALAKNIDQAKLNKAYYDYFFEGLLKNLVTQVLPILLTVAYVTKIYTPETLLSRFGREWIFIVSKGSESPVNVGSLFWFVICLILSYILFAIIKKIFTKRDAQKDPA